MSKSKNEYLELFSDGSIKMVPAKDRNINEIISHFESQRGFKKISKNLVEFEINSSIKTVAIFRLVPEGNEGSYYRKRVQISKADIDRVPDYIIVVYKNEDNIIYIRTSSVDSVVELPNSVTTLFRIDIREIKRALNNEIVKIENVSSRSKKTTLYISKNLDSLFSDDINNVESFSFNFGNDDEEFSKIEIGEDVIESNIDDFILEDTSTEVGYFGEKVLYNDLTEHGPISLELENMLNGKIRNFSWLNQIKESFKPFDFKVNDDLYVEVKTSEDFSSSAFFLSFNEFKILEDNYKNYYLVKINGADSKEETYVNYVIYKGSELLKMGYKPVKFIFDEEEKN